MNTPVRRGTWCAAVIAMVSISLGAQERSAAVSMTITHNQLENMQERIAAATAVVDRFEPEAKRRGLGSGWRQSSLETLLSLSLEHLERVSRNVVSVDSLAAAVADAADDPGVLGDVQEDLVYKPISPCRFIDTRRAVGPINGIRGFDLNLSGAAYGGDAACNPTALIGGGFYIGGFAANLTIVGPAAAPGFAAIKGLAAEPTSSVLNWYETGPNVQVANAGAFRTAPPIFLATPFVIQTSASTHAILDLFGFFIPPQATALQLSVQQATTSIGDGAGGHQTSPNCPPGYSLSGGGCYTQHVGHILESTNPVGVSGWECWTRNDSGGASNLTAFAMCVRVPGR